MNRPSNRTFQVAAALASLLALTTLGLMGSSCQKLKAPQACRTSAGSSETAEARTSADWLQKHERFVSAAANRPIELLFVGDSITAYWANEGQEVWARSFDGSRSDRFGIPGDEPKHLLARLDSGELVTPNVLKAVVLLIGTNSLSSDSATRIAAGATAAVEKIVACAPDARVVVMGILPRNDLAPSDFAKIALVNAELANLADGNRIHFLDIGPLLVAPDGSIPTSVMYDGLHLTAEGYRIWAQALNPLIAPQR